MCVCVCVCVCVCRCRCVCVCFYLFRSKLCRNNGVRDGIHVLLFSNHNFMKTKYFLSTWIRSYHFVPERILKKTLTFEN